MSSVKELASEIDKPDQEQQEPEVKLNVDNEVPAKKRIKKKIPIMGGSLVEYAKRKKCLVPKIVKRLITEIESRDMAIKGLYRIAGNSRQMKYIIAMFENSNGKTIVIPEETSIHSLANVLKRYLRTLKEPLITFDVYEEFIKMAKDYELNEPPEAVVKSTITDLMLRLPKPHLFTLATVAEHLGRVMENSEQNKMGLDNISSMLVMSFLRPPTERHEHILEELHGEIMYQIRAVKLLLKYRDLLEHVKTQGKHNPDKQLYFRVPFVYRDDTYNKYSADMNRCRGLFLIHFDDGYVARQIELHPGMPPLTFSRKDQSCNKMCKPSLQLTRLANMEEAHITAEKFNEAWTKYGGDKPKPKRQRTSKRSLNKSGQSLNKSKKSLYKSKQSIKQDAKNSKN